MHSKWLQVTLIDTSPSGQRGSMARYADLLSLGLEQSSGVSVSRINLALPQHLLQKFPLRVRMWVHHAWILLAVAFRRLTMNSDLYHVLDGSHGYVASFLPAARTVVTAHDIIPLLQTRKLLAGGVPGAASRLLINAAVRGLRRSSKVICDSTSTLDDMARYGNVSADKLTVIFPALSETLSVSVDQLPGWRARRYCEQPFMLHIGHNGFYKNRAGVLRVFAIVASSVPGIRLKLAGPPLNDELVALSKDLAINDRIECVENPDDIQVLELYQHAALLLFPSLYEGFGWPPLEAMSCGCPVVCSSEGSLAEVVADAALTAPAADEEMLARHCIDMLEKEGLAEEMVERGCERVRHFQLDEMVKKMIAIYQQVAQ